MLKSDPEISTEFRGVDSITFGVFGKGELSEIEEETGCKIFERRENRKGYSFKTLIPNEKRKFSYGPSRLRRE